MILQKTALKLVPESIQEKWMIEASKNLTYPLGVTCITIETPEELERMVRGLMANQDKLIGFDTEASSVRPESASIVGMSFACEDDRGFYVPVGHSFGKQMELGQVMEIVEPVLQSGSISMAGGKYDWHLLKRHGYDVKFGLDSQVLSRLLGEVEYGVGLKPTVARMFGERMIEFGDVVTKSQQTQGKTFADIEIGLATLYAVPDAIYTRRVSLYAMEHMPESIKRLLLEVEHEAMRFAAMMDYNGMPLDHEYLERHLEAGNAMMETLRVEAIEGLRAVAVRKGAKASDVPDDLKLNSAAQMRKVLFEMCKFRVVRKTKNGNPSVDKQAIKTMAETEPEVDWVQRYRSCRSRIVDLEELLNLGIRENDWFFVHGSLNPEGTSTGRWSSSRPNQQNMTKGESVYASVHSEWRVSIRDAIVAPPGWFLVTADYGQIELRVAAGESQCRMWLDAFASGDDVHSASGSAIYGVPIAEVTAKQRQDGKTFNFALLFGQEVKSTAGLLGVSVAEAQKMQNAFWNGLPEVKSWITAVQRTVRRKQYVETKFGRRRWLRGVRDINKYIVLQNLREATNTVVQGTAADILKIGLTRQEPVAIKHGAKLFLVIHDEYVWMVPESVRPDVFCTEMDAVINFGIPGYPKMVSDYGIGKSFDSLIGFTNATDVPPTWAEVFERQSSEKVDHDDKVLYVVCETITIDELSAMRKLLADNPGENKVIVSINGVEYPKWEHTSFTVDNELEIRAAIGNTARVSLI